MKFTIDNIRSNPQMSLRRAGYTFQRHAGEEMSFIRPFSASGYPRFHIYAKVEKFSLQINIHMDMKKETYGSDTRHHGEYDTEESDVLRDEVRRLKNILED